MASTNKTANIGLNQWVLTDPFLMEDMNADNRKIDAAVGSISFVKLMDVTTSANAVQVDIDLSGIDFTKYARIEIFAAAEVTPLSTAQYLYARLNYADIYIRTPEYSNMSLVNYLGYVYTNTSVGTMSKFDIEISGFPETLANQYMTHIRTHGISCYNNPCLHDYIGCKLFAANTKPDVLSFVTEKSNVSIKAGARFEIYGVRK